MQRWEYLRIEVWSGYIECGKLEGFDWFMEKYPDCKMISKRPRLDTDCMNWWDRIVAIDEYFDHLGFIGWEIVGMDSDPERIQSNYVFKRPLSN